ncbi:hypothetical protein EGT45_18815 [Yersinia pestis]|nr:hypothetical protein EGT45_18815 [Yersinia pestis]ROZ94935.1 hypothetical protein EGT46_07385 [Yersinia pestis]
MAQDRDTAAITTAHDLGGGGFLCPENPQLGWGFSKAFSFGSVIKTPFDLLKQFAVWQLQMFNKKSKGGPNEG